MAARPRIQAMIQDAVTAVLLDDEDRASAKQNVQKAAKGAHEAW